MRCHLTFLMEIMLCTSMLVGERVYKIKVTTLRAHHCQDRPSIMLSTNKSRTLGSQQESHTHIADAEERRNNETTRTPRRTCFFQKHAVELSQVLLRPLRRLLDNDAFRLGCNSTLRHNAQAKRNNLNLYCKYFFTSLRWRSGIRVLKTTQRQQWSLSSEHCWDSA